MADQILLHSLHAYHTWFVSSHPQGRAETFSGALLEEKDGCQLDMERVFLFKGSSAVLVVSPLISSAARDEESLNLIYH